MKTGLVWLRRDLRLDDHHALSRATNECDKVYLIFIFDPNILQKLERKDDPRVSFIYYRLLDLKKQIPIFITQGTPQVVLSEFCKLHQVDIVYANEDYEPQAIKRDELLRSMLESSKIQFHTFKDQVLLSPKEVLKDNGEFYKVFTPYYKKWDQILYEKPAFFSEYKINLNKIIKCKTKDIAFTDLGFIENELLKSQTHQFFVSKFESFLKEIHLYNLGRDKIDKPILSGMSLALRFGLLSIRYFARKTINIKGADSWVRELAWREFYMMILYFNPHVAKTTFIKNYSDLKFPYDKNLFKAWTQGMTGVPIVDAAMRCLNATGQMHNRLRMIVASFFCKILLLDYKLGEKYFSQYLNDFELSSNNGGWQWSASTGCDAAPYFRIFNPFTQSKKFDPEGVFIRKWCPELKDLSNKSIHRPTQAKDRELEIANIVLGEDYPLEIVDYELMRAKAIAFYKI